MKSDRRPLAVIAGVWSTVGLRLAQLCAEHDFDVIVAAAVNDHAAGSEIPVNRSMASVIRVDLNAPRGIGVLRQLVGNRHVHTLIVNAEATFTDALTAIRLGQLVKNLKATRILMTGSMTGFTSGTGKDVFGGDFLDSFSSNLQHELDMLGVPVTCLIQDNLQTSDHAEDDDRVLPVSAPDGRVAAFDATRVPARSRSFRAVCVRREVDSMTTAGQKTVRPRRAHRVLSQA